MKLLCSVVRFEAQLSAFRLSLDMNVICELVVDVMSCIVIWFVYLVF